MRKVWVFLISGLLVSCANQSDVDWLNSRVANLEKTVYDNSVNQNIINEQLVNADVMQQHNDDYVENELDKINLRFSSLESKLDRLFTKLMQK